MRFLILGLCVVALFAQSDEAIYSIGGDVSKPKLISLKDPDYSEAARREHIQGIVVLRVVVTAKGETTQIKVLSPLGFGLDEKAVEAVSQWRFKPAEKAGKAVSVRAQVEVHFKLASFLRIPKAETQRTHFNIIVSQIADEPGHTPSEKQINEISNLAKEGLPAANYLLGSWQIDGKYVPKDTDTGWALIQKAVVAEYGPALYFLGESQIKGDLVPKDEAHGIELIQKAAFLGSKVAQFRLGAMFETGRLVPADSHEAMRNFRLCAARAVPQCQLHLARLLLGSPMRMDYEQLEAVAWLQLASDHGLATARDLAASETAKLTGDEAQRVSQLKTQLERSQ